MLRVLNTSTIGKPDFLTTRILAFWHEVLIIGKIMDRGTCMAPRLYGFRVLEPGLKKYATSSPRFLARSIRGRIFLKKFFR